MNNRKVELTEQEVDDLYAMIHLLGFREKREFPMGLRKNRTEMQRKMGKVLKKLRKGKHFISA